MIYRIFPSKDTFITNSRRGDVPQTGSNFGASEVLHVFKATQVGSSASLARALVQFDLSAIVDLTGSGRYNPPTSFFLRLKDVRHQFTLPSSYDLEIIPISQSWDEGRGRDVDAFADKGFANWDRAASNSWWNVPGGTTASFPGISFHVDEGHEDLIQDITPIVQAWIQGTIPNNGLMVRISSSQEADANDYYIKKFFSRNAFYPNHLPYLEARWDDTLRDNRSNFVYDVSNTLYLYNEIRGQLTDISGIGTGSLLVRIVDSSGTLFSVTGSHTGLAGIYSSSFVLSTGSYSGSAFYDVWESGSRAFMTGVFYPTDQFAQTEVRPHQYFVAAPNLKDEYDRTEFPRLNFYIRSRDFNPAVVHTSSFNQDGICTDRIFYRIDNDRTDEIIVPFGTGSLEYTRMSYDRRGNYFRFFMGNLPAGEVYRLLLLIDSDGERQLIDNDFKFRVV